VAQVASEPIAEHLQVQPELGGEPSEKVVGRSPWQLFRRRFRRDKFAIAGIVFIALMIAVALGAPLIADLHGCLRQWKPNKCLGCSWRCFTVKFQMC
jgi:hypothetical protein